MPSSGEACVGLVGLHPREVGAFALGEAVLSVELELGGDHGVKAPAVHVQRCFAEHKGAGIGDTGVVVVGLIGEGCELGHGLGVKSGISQVGGNVARAAKVGLVGGITGARPVSGLAGSQGVIDGAGIVEEALLVDVLVFAGNRIGSAERVNGVGKGIKGVGVIERLGAQHLEEHAVAHQRRAVINVLIGLHDPDKLLDGVVEVELNLVGRRTNGLVAGELQLRDEVLVGLLGEASALVGVKEHVIDVKGSGDQRLVVGDGGGHGGSGLEVGGLALGSCGATEGGDGPQALVDGTNVEVDFDFVVLQGNKRKGQTGIGAKPKLEGHVESGLGERVTGSAHLAGSQGVARSVNLGERGVGDECELGGVANHLEVATLLLGSHCQLIPDVHPVAILAVDALTADFDLHLGDELLTGEVQPAGIDAISHASGNGSDAHELIDFGKSHLQISSVSQIAISANRALHATTKVGLTVKGLLDRLNGEVSVSAIRDFPESNLGVAREVDVLGTVGHNL